MHATQPLPVHDSTAAAVVVSLGAGGAGIGRRTARPPQRETAEYVARAMAPEEARLDLGGYRTGQREMPSTRSSQCEWFHARQIDWR